MSNVTIDNIIEATADRKPDFSNLLKVLHRETPDRPTLFEFFLNPVLEQKFSRLAEPPKNEQEYHASHVEAFRAAGYDYVTSLASSFAFPKKDNNHGKSSISLNEGFVITDRETYNAYNWPSPEDFSTDGLKRMADYLPDGMKIIIFSPDGILENVIRLIGYENLCYLLYDEPDVVSDVFEQVGSRIYRYYKTAIDLDCVGGIIYNDDWGFNQQTMISADDMRNLLFPHVYKIVKLAHSCDKPVILHSCGQLNAVYDDIISMGIDGKHSYEDIIEPVESAYDKLHDRIAVIGGMDLDYVCRKTPAEVNDRARAMCKKTGFKAYALGTGNSVPTYVPEENYLAMTAAALL